jgi:hypothetical protein
MKVCNRKYFYCISFFFLFQISNLLAQADENEEEIYRKETTFGINFNTNGGLIGGGILKFAISKKSKQFTTFGLEVVGIKHPKEYNITSQLTGNSYTYGKLNYLFSTRLQYGKDFILFRKAPEEGVKVSAIVAGGPSIGILKPYYISYQYSPTKVVVEPFDPNKHVLVDAILGAGNFFQGFDYATLVPGFHLKLGISCDFGTFKNAITGFEGGVTFETFFQEVPLLIQANNSRVYSAAYLTFFIGSKKEPMTQLQRQQKRADKKRN